MELAALLIILGVLAIFICLLPLPTPIRTTIAFIAGIGIASGLLILLFHNWIYKVPTYTKDDLLLVLSHDWKSTSQLRDELSELKGVGDSLVDMMFREANFGWLYAKLDELEMEGLVESTITLRDKPIANYLTQRVYRLTEGGMRAKDDAFERSRHVSVPAGRFKPQTT